MADVVYLRSYDDRPKVDDEVARSVARAQRYRRVFWAAQAAVLVLTGARTSSQSTTRPARSSGATKLMAAVPGFSRRQEASCF